MTNSAVEEIKERLGIEEVVSSYIKLEKSGINLKACCPFHNEKTPSFFVSPDRGSFYCFGCSKGGDIFTFIQEIEGVDFKEALKILADKAGVDVSKYSFEKSEKLDDTLYVILEKATKFFENKLENINASKEYLLNRGIENKIIKKFRIGYALDEWQSLYDFLKKEKYTDQQIINTGLVIKNEKGRIYDRFRGRVIFPIFDDRGRPVAFSARILTDAKDQPKYINSPETELFNKSKILYGFNFAKQTIRKHDFAILTEGQMDVILSHQIGYTNCVASSGTSFTEDQLQIIKRHTNNLLIAFDGDSAGLNSSKKVWNLALKNDMDVKVLSLPSGQDPADIISSDVGKWKELVKDSKHIVEHIAVAIKEKIDDNRKQQKEVQKEIYPYIQNLKSYTDKSFFVEKISDMFGIDRDAIWADVNSEELTVQEKQKKENRSLDEVKFNEREILYGIYFVAELKDKEEYLKKIKEFITEDLIQEMNKRKEKILFETENFLSKQKDREKSIKEVFTSLKLKVLEERRKSLSQTIKTDEDPNNMKKLIAISREIESVKKKGCQDLDNVI